MQAMSISSDLTAVKLREGVEKVGLKIDCVNMLLGHTAMGRTVRIYYG